MHELLAKRLAASTTGTLRVKVIPKSPRTEIVGELADGTLKVKVAAVPERGKANAELCGFLAKEAGVPLASVQLIAGQTSPIKIVRISR